MELEQQGFSATLLYKGYLDDPRNTDNAWVEAEVWNFHYDIGDDFDMRLKMVSTCILLGSIIFQMFGFWFSKVHVYYEQCRLNKDLKDKLYLCGL